MLDIHCFIVLKKSFGILGFLHRIFIRLRIRLVPTERPVQITIVHTHTHTPALRVHHYSIFICGYSMKIAFAENWRWAKKNTYKKRNGLTLKLADVHDIEYPRKKTTTITLPIFRHKCLKWSKSNKKKIHGTQHQKIISE